MIAGHEPCGIVAAVGTGVAAAEARVGQRVMDHHYQGCGGCKHCRSGWTQMCLDGSIVFGASGHGGHARYMKVPVETLVPLPDALSFEAGAAVSCGTGTAYGALKRLALQGGETIAVFGQGPVGLSATQLAVAMGARVIALDVAPERRKLAREFGAHEVIDARSNNPVEAIRELTHGEGAHKTLDTSGAAEARAAAVRATRSWGTACFVGERGQVTLDVSPDLLRRQITLVGSWTSRARARPSAPSSWPTTLSPSTSSSPTAGGSTRPRRPTACSTRRPRARASSCRRERARGRHDDRSPPTTPSAFSLSRSPFERPSQSP